MTNKTKTQGKTETSGVVATETLFYNQESIEHNEWLLCGVEQTINEMKSFVVGVKNKKTFEYAELGIDCLKKAKMYLLLAHESYKEDNKKEVTI